MCYSSCKQTVRYLHLPKLSCERDISLMEDILHSTTSDKPEQDKGQGRTSQSLAIVAIKMLRLKKFQDLIEAIGTRVAQRKGRKDIPWSIPYFHLMILTPLLSVWGLGLLKDLRQHSYPTLLPLGSFSIFLHIILPPLFPRRAIIYSFIIKDNGIFS